MADELKPWEKAAQQSETDEPKPWEKAAKRKKKDSPASLPGYGLSGSGSNPFLDTKPAAPTVLGEKDQDAFIEGANEDRAAAADAAARTSGLGLAVPATGIGSSLRNPGGLQEDFTKNITNTPTALEAQETERLAVPLQAFAEAQGEETAEDVFNYSQQANNGVLRQGQEADPLHDALNYPGHLYNEFLRGTGSLANALVETAAMAAKGNPLMQGLTNDAVISAYRKEVAPEVRDFLKDQIGADVDKGQEARYNDNFVLGAIGGLANSGPAILASGITGGASLFLQAFDAGLQSVGSMEGADQLDEDTKTIYASTIGLVVSKLEKYGLDKIIKGSGITNAIVKKIINMVKGSGGKVTGDVLEKMIDKQLNGLAGKYAKVGIKAFDGIMVEGFTGGTQGIATIASEDLLNRATGKSIFDTSDASTWKGFLGRVAKEAGQEAVGGGIMAGGLGILTTKRKAKVNKVRALLNQVNEQLDNPDLAEGTRQVLVQQKIKLTGELETQDEQEQGQQAKYTPEEKAEATELNEQLLRLEEAMNDPALPAELMAKLQEDHAKTEEKLTVLNDTVARRPKELPEHQDEQAPKDNEPSAPVLPGEAAAPTAESPAAPATEAVAGTATPVTLKGPDVATGQAVTIKFNKNPEKAPDMGSEFGQDVEPAGNYVTQNHGFVPEGYQTGEVSFKNPLVIDITGDTQIEWKRTLSQENGGKTGAELTAALKEQGHDGIITRIDGELGEIIDFSQVEASTGMASDPEGRTEKEAQYEDATPDQLAGMYVDEVNNPTHLSPVEQAISEHPFAIKKTSYVQFGDKNNISDGKARSYFSQEKGHSADVIAQTINDRFFNGENVVEPQDIVDFIDRFPDGVDSVHMPSGNPALAAINDAYFEKTGKKLNRATAKRYADAAAKAQTAAASAKISAQLTSLIEEQGLTLANIDLPDVQGLIDFLKPDDVGLDEATQLLKDYLNGKQEPKAEGKGGKKGAGPDADGGNIRPKGTGKAADGKAKAERKSAADKVRKAKVNTKNKQFEATLGLPLAVWNGAVETVASAIEAGVAIADAIKRGIKYIEKNHRGKWDKRIYNEQVVEALGHRGITVNGQDLIVKPVTEKESAELIDGFYSPLEQGIKNTEVDKATGKEWARRLNGVTEGDELKYTGVAEFLRVNEGKQISKKELLKFMTEHRIQVEEVVLGKRATDKIPTRLEDVPDAFYMSGLNFRRKGTGFEFENASRPEQGWSNAADNRVLEYYRDSILAHRPKTKYSQYTLEGDKEGYREVLITMPVIPAVPDFNIEEEIKAKEAELAHLENYYLTSPKGKFMFFKDWLKTQGKHLTQEEIDTEFEEEGIWWNQYTDDRNDKLFDISELRSILNALKGKAEGKSNDAYHSGHFDQPNIVAHVRMDVRTDKDGNKVLFLEEIQSDWGQTGKREGFKGTKSEKEIKLEKVADELVEKRKAINKEVKAVVEEMYELGLNTGASSSELEDFGRGTSRKITQLQKQQEEVRSNREYDAINDEIDAIRQKMRKLAVKRIDLITQRKALEDAHEYAEEELAKEAKSRHIPLAPFVTDTNNWAKLGVKYALKHAVAEGVKKMVWTSGSQQNDRYNLSKSVDNIAAVKNDDGTYSVSAQKDGSLVYNNATVKEKELEAVIGKELAEKIIKDQADQTQVTQEDVDKEDKALQEESMAKFGIYPNSFQLEDIGTPEAMALAERVRKNYRRQFNVQRQTKEPTELTGDNLKVGGKGMKGFYGEPQEGSKGIVGGIIESLLGEGTVKETTIEGAESNGRPFPTVKEVLKGRKLEEMEKPYWVYNHRAKEMIYTISDGKVYRLYDHKDIEEAAGDIYGLQPVKETSTQHSVDITPEIEEAVKAGLPLFNDPQKRKLAKDAADKVRGAKINTRGKAFDGTLGLPIAVWNGAVETVASAIEAGVAIADAIKRGIKYIEKNHRGRWDKKIYNEKVIEALGHRGITVAGEDMIVKPVADKRTAELVNGFYSPLEQGILNINLEKATAKEWIKRLNGVTEGDELKYTGLAQMLEWMNEDNSPVSKEQLLDWLKENRIELAEVVLDQGNRLDDADDLPLTFTARGWQYRLDNDYGWQSRWLDNPDGEWLNVTRSHVLESYNDAHGSQNTSKYGSYTLDGDKADYKEVLITLPVIPNNTPSKILNSDKTELAELESTYYRDRQHTIGTSFIDFKDWLAVNEIALSPEEISDQEIDEGRLFQSYKEDRTEKRKRRIALKDQIERLGQEKGVAFTSGHFAPHNILAHVRLDMRTDTEGKKVLFVEEVQSDWGQKGKRKGFMKTDAKLQADYNQALAEDEQTETVVRNIMRGIRETSPNTSIADQLDAGHPELTEAYNINEAARHKRMQLLNAVRKMQEGVVDGPYVKDTNSWTKLGIKVALKHAVDQGADKMAWTTGEQQNDRYDLSKQVDEVVAFKHEDGTYKLEAYKEQDAVFNMEHIQEKELEAYLGKELAEKIIADQKSKAIPTVADVNKEADELDQAIRDKFGISTNIPDLERIGTPLALEYVRRIEENTQKWMAAHENKTEQTHFKGVELKVGGKGMKGFYGIPEEGKLGIVGDVVKSMTRQEPKPIKIQGPAEMRDFPTTEELKAEGRKLTAAELESYSIPKHYYTQAPKESAYTIYNNEVFRIYTNEDLKAVRDTTNYEGVYVLGAKAQTFTQHSIDITPAITAAVKAGLPLFNDPQKSFWDTVFDTSEVKGVVDMLEGFKFKSKGAQSKVLPAAELVNAAISIIQTAIKAGATLKNAVQLAVDHLRASKATQAQIDGFVEYIKGKIKIDRSGKVTIKHTIRENTDSRSKAKIIMTELQAIKKQMKDRFAGFKEGLKEGVKLQKEKQQALDDITTALREELLAVMKTARDLKLFNGKHVSQTGLLNILKLITNAGNNPYKLMTAVDKIIKRFEVMDYDNKILDANKLRQHLQRQFFQYNQKTVSTFLGLDPEDISVEDFYDYLHALGDLKRHLDPADSLTISDFNYIADFTARYHLPSTRVTPPAPAVAVVTTPDMKKPTKSFKEKVLYELKQFRDNWLNFRQGMPKHLHALKEKMMGNINVENYQAMLTGRALGKMIAADPSVKIEDVDAALRGDIDKLNELPEKIGDAVVKMRAHIDRLSQELIDKGFVPDTQKATIEVNLGTYLNRSYELFSSKNWTLENLPEVLYNRATQLLYPQYYKDYKINNPTLSEAEIEKAVKNRVEAKIREYFGKESNKYFNQANDGSKDLSIMMERGDIPVELRALFGEITDPIHNYLNTVSKMASLVESNRFLHNLRENALGSLIFDKDDLNRPAEASVMIASEGTESMSPLNGLYTTPELAAALKEHRQQVPHWVEVYLTGIGLVKAGKTVGSIITHIKNIEGNIGFMLANGHWPNGDLTRAVKAVGSDLLNMDNKLIEEMIIPAIKLGVIKQGVEANEIKRMFDPNQSDAETYSRMFGRKKTLGQKVKGKLFGFGRGLTNVYQAEDDFFKLFAYMSDMKRYAWALYPQAPSTAVALPGAVVPGPVAKYNPYQDTLKNLTPDQHKELQAYVAELVKNTYPTYSRVAKLARVGSMYIPVLGNFVSFQAESYRVGYNIAQQAAKELKSDNPRLREIGAHRVTGLTAYMGIKHGLLAAIGNAGIGGILGYFTDDEEKEQRDADMRRYVAGFSAQSDILMMKGEPGYFNYIDMSSYDPWGSQVKIINAAFNARSPVEAIGEAMFEFVKPFVGWEITFGMGLSLYANKDAYDRQIYNPEEDLIYKARDVAKFIYRAVEPGTFSWIRRLWTGGDETGEIKALAYRTHKIDIGLQFRRKMQNYNKREDNIEQIYKKEYYSKDSTPESRKDALDRANEKLDALVKEMNMDYAAGIRLGATVEKMNGELSAMKMPKKKMKAIKTGVVDKYNIKSKENKTPASRLIVDK